MAHYWKQLKQLRYLLTNLFAETDPLISRRVPCDRFSIAGIRGVKDNMENPAQTIRSTIAQSRVTLSRSPISKHASSRIAAANERLKSALSNHRLNAISDRTLSQVTDACAKVLEIETEIS